MCKKLIKNLWIKRLGNLKKYPYFAAYKIYTEGYLPLQLGSF